MGQYGPEGGEIKLTGVEIKLKYVNVILARHFQQNQLPLWHSA